MSISIDDKAVLFKFSKLVNTDLIGHSKLDNYNRNIRRKLLIEEVLKEISTYHGYQNDEDKKRINTFITRRLLNYELLSHKSRFRYEVLIFFKHLQKMDEFKRFNKEEKFEFQYSAISKDGDLPLKELKEIQKFLNPLPLKEGEKLSTTDATTIYRSFLVDQSKVKYSGLDIYQHYQDIPKGVKIEVNQLRTEADARTKQDFERRKKFWMNNSDFVGYKKKSLYKSKGCIMQPCFIWSSESKGFGKTEKDTVLDFGKQPQKIRDFYIQKAQALKDEESRRPAEGVLTFPLHMLERVKTYIQRLDMIEQDRAAKRRMPVPEFDDDDDFDWAKINKIRRRTSD